jgi:ABC-type branched-subunit amino acid transport system ATPase component
VTDGAATPAVLSVRDVSAGYGESLVVEGVSVDVGAGGIVAIIGPNGGGKSTFLKAVYGVLKPRSGSVHVLVDGRSHDVTGREPYELTRLGLNFVPQLENVFPSLSVLENIEVATLAVGRDKRRVAEVLEWFPVLRARRRQRAGTLSGGERKMLALARALVSRPKILLLDEPSAALAPAAVDDVFAKLVEINESGIAIVMVEQNARRALALSDYGYVLDMGRNRYEGPGSKLLDDPKVVDLYLGGARHEQA